MPREISTVTSALEEKVEALVKEAKAMKKKCKTRRLSSQPIALPK